MRKMETSGRKQKPPPYSSSSSRTNNNNELLIVAAETSSTLVTCEDMVDDSVEKSKRSRHDFFFRHCGCSQKQIISVILGAMMLILGLSCVDRFMGLRRSIKIKRSSFFPLLITVPGYGGASTTTTFTPIPNHYAAVARRQVCIAKGQNTVIRAFRQRGWSVVSYVDTFDSGREQMKKCTLADDGTEETSSSSSSSSVILWTKHKPYASFYKSSQPWQRHNWLPNQNIISSKGSLIRGLKEYAVKTGRSIDFLPESYVLPVHYEELLHRMLLGGTEIKDTVEEKDEKSNTEMITGLNEPWVLKLAATDNGIGIAMLGPNSDSLHTLIRLLQQSPRSNSSKNNFTSDAMSQIREQLVFARQVNDNRDAISIQRARKRSATQNDDIIVQRYVCNELDYYGHKFDLRVFWLVASVNPLVVLYHDGTLRVALSEYNDTDFTSTSSHLTNIGRNRVIDNCTASFADFEVILRAHVAANPGLFSTIVQDDPLLHIRRQIMDALATVVASARHSAFDLHGKTDTENGFALMGGDFIVDRDLNVWITEAQSSPGLGHETPTRTELYNRLLPSVVDILDEVLDKQMMMTPGKQPLLLPLNNTGDFELIYTDDFQYRYDFPRRLKRGPC